MLISVHDRTLKRVGYLDNDKPGTLHYKSDEWHRYLTEGSSTFDFIVIKEAGKDCSFINDECFVSFRYEGEDYLFSIVKLIESDYEIELDCETLNLELLNEQADKYTATKAMSFEEYFNEGSLIGGKGFTDLVIGINEVSGYRRTLSWDSTDTKLNRLLSLVNKFDAECEFQTKLNRDGTLNKIIVNVYHEHDDSHQGVGLKRSDVTLFYEKGHDGITRTIDKSELYSAILPTGKDGLTIAGIDRTVKDETGATLYYSKNGMIYAPQTAERYPAQISSNGDQWVLYRYDYDTDNRETLYGQGLAKLKELSAPAIEYEIEGTEGLQIGDTVTICDRNFSPELILEARVSEQVISFCDPSKNKNVYANTRALKSKISTTMSQRLSELMREATPYTVDILTDGGTTFKNGDGSTTLTARVMHGAEDVTSRVSLFAWTAGGTALGTEKTLTVHASDVSGRMVITLTCTINGTSVSAEITLTNVSDGAKGDDAVVLYIESSNGTAFKNASIATTLTIDIYVGGELITDSSHLKEKFGSDAYLQWRQKPEGSTSWSPIPSTDPRLSDNGFIFTLSANDVQNRTVFSCDLIF